MIAETFDAVEDDDDDDDGGDDSDPRAQAQASTQEELPFELEREYAQRIAWLSLVPFFASLKDDAVTRGVDTAIVTAFLTALARNKMVPDTKRAGTFFIQKDETAEVMFILKRGEAEVLLELTDSDGLSATPVAKLHEGSFFGESALYDGGLRKAFVRASSLCKYLQLSKSGLNETLGEFPQMHELLKLAEARLVSERQ